MLKLGSQSGAQPRGSDTTGLDTGGIDPGNDAAKNKEVTMRAGFIFTAFALVAAVLATSTVDAQQSGNVSMFAEIGGRAKLGQHIDTQSQATPGPETMGAETMGPETISPETMSPETQRRKRATLGAASDETVSDETVSTPDAAPQKTAEATSKTTSANGTRPRQAPERQARERDVVERETSQRPPASKTPAQSAKKRQPEAVSAPAARTTTAKSDRCANANALGVSRTIELDASGGPHFGEQQYTGNDLLEDGEVVLTFDDGPLRRYTRAVLKALDRHCTKALFFTVGRMAVADPGMLREVAAHGHTIGHHSWSHRNQGRSGMANAIAEFELGVSAVEAVIDRPSAPFFRFPYLSDPQAMQNYLGERNFGIFSIDIDSHDWRTRSTKRVHRAVMSKLKKRGKGIILFHDIQKSTAGGLSRLLDDMKRSGYRIVHFAPAAGAKSLPEYDKEARILLKTRSWKRRARPIKTAFQFKNKPNPGRRAKTPAERASLKVVPQLPATAKGMGLGPYRVAPARNPTTGAVQRGDTNAASPASAPPALQNGPMSGMPDWSRRALFDN